MSHQKFAIVGLSCRLPGNANTPREYFENLRNKKNCIVPIPQERFNAEYYSSLHEKHPARIVSRVGGLMDNFFEFDHKAFQVSKKEAITQDVQQKILLETTLHALEDSNIDYRGKNIGVFIGSTATGVIKKNMNHPYYMNEYCATGTGPSIHANLLSYKFDLRGPSFEVDTACSSSGASMYIACASIANRNCDAAVVGGIQIMLDHSSVIAFGRLGVLNVEGNCKSFDARANGFVRSEGCGVAIVKRLEDAERDGDHIYCILHCTTSNSDGGLTSSLTTPSGEAQSLGLADCLKRCDADPKEVFFLEAHCTGTKVGDPAEINGAGKILGINRSKSDFLRVGSVKGNIGHTECTSYIAGLLKICMMYENGLLLPNINYESPNPKIKFDEYNLKVQLECEKFQPQGKKIVLNSFGFGGANVCSLFEGYNHSKKKEAEEIEGECEAEGDNGMWKKLPGPYLYLVYGLTKEGLENRITQLKEFSKTVVKEDQIRLMYQLNTRRQKHYEWKTYGIGPTFEKSIFVDPIRKPEKKEKVVFVFSGQGPQNIGMGRKLYKLFPSFRRMIDYCNAYYKKISGVSLIDDIGIFGDKVGTQEELNKISNTLPSIIFIQIALFELWKSLGIHPDAVCGHSFGEMCAMYATGCCSVETILDIAYSRVKIVSQMKAVGKMIAVGTSKEDVMELIKENKLEQIWIAANNSPNSVTCGGIPKSVLELKDICSKKGIFNRLLNIGNAFHTPLICDVVDIAMKLLGESVRDIKETKIPLVSTTYPNVIWEGLLTPECFWDNIKNCVAFRQAMETSMKKWGEDTIFLELAPHPVLSYSMKQCGCKRVVGTINRRQEELSSFLKNIGEMESYGYDINWEEVCRSKFERIPDMPSYPFDRQRLFEEHEFFQRARLVDDREIMPTMLGRLQHTVKESWENFISNKTYPWLVDHVVQNSVIFPAACYTEMFFELGLSRVIEDVHFLTSMTVPLDNDGYVITNSIRDGDDMEIYSKREGNYEKCILQATAKVLKDSESQEILSKQPKMNESVESLKKRLNYRYFNQKEVYERLDEINLHYGTTFANIEECYQGDEESLSVVNTDKLPLENFYIHPSVLDATYHAAIGTIRTVVETFIPESIERIVVYTNRSFPKTAYVYCKLIEKTSEYFRGEISMFDEEGTILLQIDGFVCNILKGKTFPPKTHFKFHWQPKTLEKVLLPATEKPADPKWMNILKNWSVIDEYILLALKDGMKGLARFEDIEFSREKERYFKWAREHIKKHEHLLKNEGYDRPALDELEGFELETEIIKRVGDNWVDLVLNRKNEIRSIMFGDDLLDKFYYQSITCEPVVSEFVRVFESFVDELVTNRKRVVRILEVGSGTGAVARQLLPLLENYTGMVEYYYTDLSTGFFPDAQKLFKDFPFIRFKAIDASKRFKEQGIDDHSLDAVIAFDVLHAVDKIKGCIENVQKSLACGGYLFLLEITNRKNDCLSMLDFCFGIFQGWQFFNDFRDHCSISREQWKSLLEELKFGDIEYFGRPEEIHTMIAARKMETLPGEKKLEDVVVYDKKDAWGLVTLAQKYADKPLNLIVCLNNSKYDPWWGEVYGVAKTLVCEQPQWKTIILDFGADIMNSEEDRKKWIQKAIHTSSGFEDDNYITGGKLYCPRIIQIENLFDPPSLKKERSSTYRLERNEYTAETSKKSKRGEIDVSYREFMIPKRLKGTEMVVKVEYSSLNFKDVLLSMNLFDDLEPVMGTDFSGVIVDIGPNVTKYKIGDEVFGLSKYTFASHCVTLESVVARKPKNISHKDASAIPTVYLTAYIGLINNANIQKGDNVLIHSAAGGVGQAAIQLVQWRKGKVYATVGTEEKRKYLHSRYGVNVFGNSHSPNWDEEIASNFRNGWEMNRPDVILNSLKGENIERGIMTLSPFGKFIEIGKQDIIQKSKVSLDGFMENLSFFSVQLDRLGSFKKGQRVITSALEDLSRLFAEGILTPFVEKEFAADKIYDAMKLIQLNQHLGKIGIKTSSRPKKVEKSRNLFSFDRTYVLSGGLGAVGFELMKYMCDLGAKYVVLLSRSGRMTKYQKRTLSELNSWRLKKHVIVGQCDVTSEESTMEMYESLRTEHNFPAVGGVIHLAMVLQDTSLEKLSRDVYDRVLEPKKLGALNLMKPFVDDEEKAGKLEFGIFFSSVSSVMGNPGQINYVAGNTFCESYARYLVQEKNLRIHVISLGAIVDVGLIAEQVMLRRIMRQNLIMEDPMTVDQTCWSVKNILKGEKSNIQHIPRFNFEGSTSKLERMRKIVSHLFEFKEAGEDKGDQKSMSYESLNSILKKLLMLDEDIDPDERLTNYGVDSLQSIELASILSEKFGLEGISQMEILSGITINQLLKEWIKNKS